MIPLSKMAAAVLPSATLAAGAKAQELKAKGVQVFDFSLGEPDFPTPEHICRAGYQAMKEGRTRYTASAGILELRQAVAQWYQKTYGFDCAADQVILSNGAKHAIHNALFAICGPGDEVIIPTPYWGSYSEMVKMTGASCVFVPTTQANRFQMTPEQLRSALTPCSRMLILNSPTNPTGTVYQRSDLESLADVVLASNLAVLSDEIYERLVYDDTRATCFATVRPGMAEQTITISGFSKTYAMTGWRMGWAVGPRHIIAAMSNIQSQQTSSPSSISQYASLAALQGDQECIEKMRREFEARRDLVCRRLETMPGISFLKPEGAFYVFCNVTEHLGRTLAGKKVSDSAALCEIALESAHVNLVPGSVFGAEGYVRLSFAASREHLAAGLEALAKLLAS